MHSDSLVRRLAVFLVIAGAPCGFVAADDPWPRFRGPSGDGRAPTEAAAAATEAGPPLRWGPEENIRWRCELPGNGWSSPVIGADMIYLTAAIPTGEGENPDYDLSLLMVDPASGQLVRTVKLFRQRAADAPDIHTKNSHASPTPEIKNDRVYVHFGHQGTAATDRQGEVIWTNRELRYPPVHGNGGSPLLVGDALIVACDGGKDPFVAALDAASGAVRWRTPRPATESSSFSFCTPTAIEVEGRTQVVIPGSGSAMALDPEDGRIIWQVTYDGYSVVPKPLFADGLIFISTGFGGTRLLAIRPTGEGDVTETHVVWSMDRSVPKTPSMVADRDLLYVLSDDGILTTLETHSGDQVYRKRIGGAYSASPVLVGDRIYLVSEQGETSVIRTGRQFELLAENDLGERTLASPAVAASAIYLRTEAALYKIGD